MAADIKHFRVPLGHGIAGMVALTGQPMAITDARQDERMATDIAFAVNYVPSAILCVPLFYDDRVIGVLELLDKQTESSFAPEDMDIAGQFANIAAIAIAQSSAFLDQQIFFQAMIGSFTEIDAAERQALYRQATTFAKWADTTDALSTKARELAQCLHELILDGEQSCELGLYMLQGMLMKTREHNRLLANLSAANVPLMSGR